MKTAIFTKVFGERTLEKSFELASEIGFDGVELMCREPHFGVTTSVERARSLKSRLDDLDLEVAGMGTYTGGYVGESDDACEQELEDLRRFVELSEVMETDLIRHGVGGPPGHEAEREHYEEAATWLRRAADIAADHEKRLAVEIHAGRIPETADDAVKLLELVDRDNVGVIHDAGNMFIAGADFGRRSIETLGDRLLHVHTKDEARLQNASSPGAFEMQTERGKESFQHRLLGHGDADHQGMVDALVEAGYDGYLSVECHRPTNQFWDDVAIAAHELEAVERLIEEATVNRTS